MIDDRRAERLERLLGLDEAERERHLAELRGTEPEEAEALRGLVGAAGRLETLGVEDALTALSQGAERDLAELVGARVGSWELTRVLGEGGMGIVFEARRADGRYDQRVAIKFLVEAPASAAQRVALEAGVLARIEHPNVVRLLDAGALESGMPYLVMECVDGVPLDEYCSTRRLGRAARIELLRSACSAVAAAHRRLVAHLDLKPANVLVTADGVLKVLDFGVAQVLDGDRDGEPATRRAWTPGYASPEQRRGEPTGTACDVYALGRLVEEVLRAHPDADVEAIVARATADEPGLRYGSIDQLEVDLGRASRGEPLEARVYAPTARAWLWAKRNRALAAALLLAFASLATALVAVSGRLEETRAREHLGWVAHGEALRVSGLLQRVLLSLPSDDGGDALLSALESQFSERREAWMEHPEARGRAHEALGDAYRSRGRPDDAHRHFAEALAIARSDPGFDGNDRARLEAKLEAHVSSEGSD